MAYLLDADICIYAMAQTCPRLNQRIERAGRAVSISSIVLAELCFGFDRSERRAANWRRLTEFLRYVEVRDFDAKAARQYGEIRTHLERLGTPIGGNDMLIAAHARALDMTLVTNNRRAFDRVPDLAVENWL